MEYDYGNISDESQRMYDQMRGNTRSSDGNTAQLLKTHDIATSEHLARIEKEMAATQAAQELPDKVYMNADEAMKKYGPKPASSAPYYDLGDHVVSCSGTAKESQAATTEVLKEAETKTAKMGFVKKLALWTVALTGGAYVLGSMFGGESKKPASAEITPQDAAQALHEVASDAHAFNPLLSAMRKTPPANWAEQLSAEAPPSLQR